MSRSFLLSPVLEAYVRDANRPEHPALGRARRETAEAFADHAGMQASPELAAYLQFLVKLTGARDALEVGVFTGYSATAVALAMQERHQGDARLIACDISAEYMRHAAAVFDAAGVSDIIEPRVGPATESLTHLMESGEAAEFDFAFIDADKCGYAEYYEVVLALLRPGGLMLFDNVLWDGHVADLSHTDRETESLRAVAMRARDDERVDSVFTAIGDGLLMCMKR